VLWGIKTAHHVGDGFGHKGKLTPRRLFAATCFMSGAVSG